LNLPPPALLQSMKRASALLKAGDFASARAMLEQVLRTEPRFVEAHRLLGGALQALGDDLGAERALRAGVAIDPGWAPVHTSLGELLVHLGRTVEAESALRAAIATGRHHLRAAAILARLLNDSARPQEALEVCASFAEAGQSDLDLLTQQAAALSVLGRDEEAIALYRRIVDTAPGNGIAEYNLAAALDTAGRHGEAENAARRAISKGANMPEVHAVRARGLIGLNRFEEAEAALLRAIGQRQEFVEAQRNLVQLIWMRSGDVAAACEHLDAALRAHPDDIALLMIKARLLDSAGDARGAYACLAGRTRGPNESLDALVAASQVALKFDPVCASAHAERALSIAPDQPSVRLLFADTLLATGDADQAARIATELLVEKPDDQRLLAELTTAWRLLGDPRYARYCDYPSMARAWVLDTPRGWNDLPTYLRDLAASLHSLHGLHAHPLHQSLRNGSQTTQKNLLETEDPVIRAFVEAIDGPIRRHIEALGHDDDPLRRRNIGGYRIQGIWSVRLRGQGYHVNHVHPEGWLSSACYVELPQGIAPDDAPGPNDVSGVPADAKPKTAGWLKFGEPGTPTNPALAPEFFIRPQPGLLALFPSYFWHGTVPFDGDDTRLTIAFDLAPAENR